MTKVLNALLVLCFGLSLSGLGFSSDHADSPATIKNTNLDLTDFFAFKNSKDDSRVVFIVNVNAHEPNQILQSELFDDTGRYAILIDTSGDTTPEVTINIYFDDANRRYVFFVGNKPISANFGDIAEAEGVKAFAGYRNDPAFIDYQAYANFFATFCTKDGGYSGKGLRCEDTGEPENFFKDFNVGTMAIDVSLDLLGIKKDAKLRVWVKSYQRVSNG